MESSRSSRLQHQSTQLNSIQVNEGENYAIEKEAPIVRLPAVSSPVGFLWTLISHEREFIASALEATLALLAIFRTSQNIIKSDRKRDTLDSRVGGEQDVLSRLSTWSPLLLPFRAIKLHSDRGLLSISRKSPQTGHASDLENFLDSSGILIFISLRFASHVAALSPQSHRLFCRILRATIYQKELFSKESWNYSAPPICLASALYHACRVDYLVTLTMNRGQSSK